MPDFPIDIPDSARAVKANHPTKPNDALVREIRDFIKTTGTPHLWHGHTHIGRNQQCERSICHSRELSQLQCMEIEANPIAC